MCAFWTLPRCGSYTRVPPVPSGPCGDRDAQWGDGAGVRPDAPTLRWLHPSPPGRERAFVGIGTPGGKGEKEFEPPIPRCRQSHPSPMARCGPCGDRDARWDGEEGVCSPAPPTLSAATPESPRSGSGRAGIGTPDGIGKKVCSPPAPIQTGGTSTLADRPLDALGRLEWMRGWVDHLQPLSPPPPPSMSGGVDQVA